MVRSPRRRLAPLLAVAVLATVAGCNGLVSDDPANWTPDVLDGYVNAVVEVGDTIYLGGSFTQVRDADETTQVTRSNFVAFDAETGEISPLDTAFDGEVDAIVAAPDGESLYVAGWFQRVDGVASRSLARISTATGDPVPGFTVPPVTGRVRDLRLTGDRLWLAGAFSHVDGVAQPALATIDARTGAYDPYMGLLVSGTHNGGTTQVLKIDVTPDGRRLFAVGNFASVGGRADRQVSALDLGASTAQLAPWATSFYSAMCSPSGNTYLRDLDVSPDGAYLVITTTGGYAGGPPAPCDTIARFEARADAADVRPTWVDYTGGDTSQAVLATASAVYVGGHFRWTNNPFAGDQAGRGAVSRPGLAALDPANGLPYSWNPGRTLGVGVFDLLLTARGLWVASDTDRIGNDELHGRIAVFPAAGGLPIPHGQTGGLPGRAYLLDPASADAAVHGRTFDGEDAGPLETYPGGGIDWDLARGAVMIDKTVYVGLGDDTGSFVARTFDGTTWGPADPVDTADQLVRDGAWHADVRALTGLFFEGGRLYYTIAGNPNLFYRWFTPESQVVGAQRFTASASVTGLSFTTVRSLFVGGGQLYWVNATGQLRRIGWSGGAPVPGTAELVSGPSVDGVDWRARSVFLDTRPVADDG